MAILGPFERSPEIALGVSGGSDSMALALLLGDWTATRGGKVQALIVDHGLRPGSDTEARQVADWLRARRGFSPHILRWEGRKPDAGLQQAAREARYRLMREWCLARGVLHLAVAHQREDQGETIAMRRAHGTTAYGEAGMSAIRCLDGVRLIRPLLGIGRARLVATLRARGQDWLEDPSNLSPRFERSRWRKVESLEKGGGDVQVLGRRRQAMELALAAWVLRHVRIEPAGFVWLKPDALTVERPEIVAHGLGRVIATVGGDPWPPSPRRLDCLRLAMLSGKPGLTLGHCRILPVRGSWLACREDSGLPAPMAVEAGDRFRWSDRFAVSVSAAGRGLTLAALGERGCAALGAARRLGKIAKESVPAAARPALPALRDATGKIVAVPFLMPEAGLRAGFMPHHPLTPAGFALVKAEASIIYEPGALPREIG